MDALEFAREFRRMCYNNTPQCNKCPVSGICNTNHLEELVPIVEKWSAEHPIVRNVDYVAELLEKAGFEVDKEYLAKRCCPAHKSITFAQRDRECVTVTCEECRKWWFEEYKGEENDSKRTD